ncbi:hypothetical protein BSKO_03985 [Bryopsis sp. KO-2023]|nr:hypothetical protein BSKO_03985 [Bryopsis sp. KO-2023]
MSLWRPRYALSKAGAAAEVVASLLLDKNGSRSVAECLHQGLETYCGQLTSIMYLSGPAMCPSLNHRCLEDRDAVDTLLLRRLHWPSRRNVNVGDVIALDSPYRYGDESSILVRRVGALEGEKLVSDSPFEYLLVPPGHCWVVADNPKLEPPDVADSRYFGPVPFENVRGRVIYNGYSPQDHGPVMNSKRSMLQDGPVLECELDLYKMFPDSKAP